MKIINAYLKMWKNFAIFSGRTNAPDFWWAYLGNFIVSFILGFLLGSFPSTSFLFYLLLIYCIALVLPMLGLQIRRFHDTGRSGWSCLLSLIPLVGIIIVIVFLAQPSQNADNQYGPAGQSI